MALNAAARWMGRGHNSRKEISILTMLDVESVYLGNWGNREHIKGKSNPTRTIRKEGQRQPGYCYQVLMEVYGEIPTI